MSWKYPFSQLTEGGVVEIDGLNRGFLQAVNEVQGQLNEHNWGKGAVSSIIRAPTASTNPSLWNPTLRLNFTDNRFLNEDAFFAYVTPTHGSSIGENTVVNAGSGDAGTTPNLDTGGPPVPWLTVGTNNQVGWAGAWPVPADGRWHTMSEDNFPCALQFFLTSETQIYILLSFQWLGLRESAGSMFGIKINGNLITESIIGSGDLQIEPYSRVGDIPGAGVPNPERMEAAPTPCPSSRLGYPFCAEAIVTAPPGVVTVEAVVRRAASDLVPNAIGSRELIVLKLAR